MEHIQFLKISQEAREEVNQPTYVCDRIYENCP